jgi:glutamate dehydrogenase
VVNALGPTFVSSLVAERGAEPAEVVRAYRIARAVTGADARWGAIEAVTGTIDHDVELELMGGVDAIVEDVARWYAAHAPGRPLADAIESGTAGFAALGEAMGELRSEEWLAGRAEVAAALIARGVPEEVARRHAWQTALVHVPDAVFVAKDTGRDVLEAGRALFAVGDGLNLEWIEHEIDGLTLTGRVQRWAVRAVRDDVLGARRMLAHRALVEQPELPAVDAVNAFLETRAEPRRRLTAFTRALAHEGTTDLAALTLAVRHLRALAD